MNPGLGRRTQRGVNPSRQARFEALFAAHYGDVHRYALRRAEPPLAEEVVNEAFLVAWRRLDACPTSRCHGCTPPPAHVLANRRREASPPHAPRRAPRPPSRPATVRDPADRLAERDAALRAFAALAEPDREALRLVAWERLSLADAARAAGVSRTAFAMRVHRARRRLAARAARAGRRVRPRPSLEPADA